MMYRIWKEKLPVAHPENDDEMKDWIRENIPDMQPQTLLRVIKRDMVMSFREYFFKYQP